MLIQSNETFIRDRGQSSFLKKQPEEEKIIKNPHKPTYKVVTVGDKGIGKTSLLKRLKINSFTEDVTRQTETRTD